VVKRRRRRRTRTLVVAGDVTQTLTVTAADLKAMPRTTVTVTEEGREIKYDGVLVGELLKRAGAPVGRDLSAKGRCQLRARERQGRLSGRVLVGGSRPGVQRPTTSSWRTRSTANRCSTIRGRFVLSRRTTSVARARSGCCKRIEVVRLVK